MALLQGSIVNCQLSDASQEECEDKRQFLKSQLRLAWSGEAVKQGVAHAKKAEYDMALGCYKKVPPYTHTFAISPRHTSPLHHATHCNLVQIALSKLYCPHSASTMHTVVQCYCLPAGSEV